MPFDFYLPIYNICIEFDGIQHKNGWNHKSKILQEESFKIIKNNDNVKNNYCKDNNIELLRIPYSKIKKINKVLDEKFKENK